MSINFIPKNNRVTKNHHYGSETYGEDLPTLPKNFVPLFMKMYDKGKVVDFSMPTLSLMKKWFKWWW